MTQSNWRPRRVLVAGVRMPALVDHLARARPDLEFKAVPLDGIGPEHLDWAEVYLGFRRPPTLPHWGKIRWIHCIGAGVDGIVFGIQIPGSVVVTKSSEDFGPAIGEWCVTRALAVNQHLAEFAADQAARRWDREREPIPLAGQRVVILGTGLVGSGIARAFKALGCRVDGLSRSGAARPGFDHVGTMSRFGEFLTGTDWFILAAPLTADTSGFIDRARLAECGGAYLMNAGRGAVTEEAAIPEAIDRGWLSGAALDVFTREPLPPESPLWSHPKITISPHISGPSTVAATAEGFLESLAAIEAGRPLRLQVDPAAGY
jgi:phosphoglycerate dehydrogenase-like enzyme